MLKPLLNRTALALILASATAFAPLTAAAQTAEPAALAPADFAPALLRNDSITGVYELADWAEEGLLFVASVPEFKEGTAGYIHVLDRNTLSELRQIRLPRRPFALALNHKTGRLYAGNTLDGSLTEIDAKSGQILREIQLGKAQGDGGFEHTRMIALDEEKGLAFVTSPGLTGVIWIVDLAEGKLLHRIEGGLWMAGAAYDAGAGRFYGSGGGLAEIAVVDVAAGSQTGTIATGDTTEAGPENSKHFFVNLDIDPASQRLFAADGNTGNLYAIDITGGKVAGTAEIGLGALDVTFNAKRGEIYATWRGVSQEAPEGNGGVVIFDASDLSVKARIPLEAHPNSLEVSEDGETLFVSVKMPHGDKHPAYRERATDSVLRFTLAQLLPG